MKNIRDMTHVAALLHSRQVDCLCLCTLHIEIRNDTSWQVCVCVCGKVVCERVLSVCDKLCVKELCVKELCVKESRCV